MSKRKSNSTTVGNSERKCTQCRGGMITRKHPEITQKLRNQYFYFSQWDYCEKCNKVFFNENYKVLNPKGVVLEEYNQQQEFINRIGKESINRLNIKYYGDNRLSNINRSNGMGKY